MQTHAALSTRTLLVVLVLFITAALSWKAGADRVVELAPTIGLVDVQRVVNSAEELERFNRQLESEVGTMQQELDSLLSQMESLAASLSETPATDRENRRRIRAQLFEVETRAKVRKEILQNDIDIRKGDAVRVVYERMIAAIETIAAREGIDVVLFDDRAIRPGEGWVEQRVNQAIQARRVLRGSQQADLTDRVVNLMNENFRAGR